jgi:hypothetical protein
MKDSEHMAPIMFAVLSPEHPIGAPNKTPIAATNTIPRT